MLTRASAASSQTKKAEKASDFEEFAQKYNEENGDQSVNTLKHKMCVCGLRWHAFLVYTIKETHLEKVNFDKGFEIFASKLLVALNDEAYN